MKPSDLMLSLLDFLGIVLPGMIATWLVVQYLPSDLQASFRISGADPGAFPWLVYLFTSYGLGHFVFMGGSKLDPAYDSWRRRTKPMEKHASFQAANRLRERLTPELAGSDFSTFKWARSYVAIHSAEMRLELERLEAESKFFRGIVVVSMALMLHFLIFEENVTATAVLLVGGALSFSRFCEQRSKLTELAYATAIILDATKAAHLESKKAAAKAD